MMNSNNGLFKVQEGMDSGGAEPIGMTHLNDDDVKLVGSRLFVGNINDKTTRENIENRFGKYGRVIGVTMHRDCCYVQYEDEKIGQLAIKEEHQSIMFGNKLEVRMEKDERTNKDAKPRFVSPSARRRSPSFEGRRDRREHSRESSNYYRPSYRERSPPSMRGSRDGYDNNGSYRRDGENRNSRTRFDSPIRDRSLDSNPYFNVRQTENRDLPPQYRVRGSYENYVDYVKPLNPNDCEVIVMEKPQRAYGELVERKLKSAGLQVELLFPKDNIPIVKLLGDISSRGCLYAIVILPQNESHKSITVNILYGTPQEHRNMPLDDAVKFISRNFDMQTRERAARFIAAKLCGPPIPPLQEPPAFIASNNPVAYAAPQQRVLNSQTEQQMNSQPLQRSNSQPQQHLNNQPQKRLNSHPVASARESEVQTLIQILANGKPLTVSELDRVIKHLEETRSKLIASNSGGTYNSDPAHPRQHLELQQKIISLFGGPTNNSSNVPTGGNIGRHGTPSYDDRGDSGIGTYGSGGANRRKGGENRWGPPIKTEPAGSSALNINLENPNVQKALDNLLQSGPNILKCLDVPADRDRGYSNNSSRLGQPTLDRTFSGGMASRNMDVDSRNVPLLSTPIDHDSRNVSRMPNSRDHDSRNRMQMERALDQDSRNIDMESRDIDSCFRDIDCRNLGQVSSSNMDMDRYNRGPDQQRIGMHGRNVGPGNVNPTNLGDGDRYESRPSQGMPFQGQGSYNQRPFY